MFPQIKNQFSPHNQKGTTNRFQEPVFAERYSTYEVSPFCVDVCHKIVSLLPDVAHYDKFKLNFTDAEIHMIYSYCASVLLIWEAIKKNVL